MISKSKIRIIEFTGLPACGKTTLCSSMLNDSSNYVFYLSSEFSAFGKEKVHLLSLFRHVPLSYLITLIYYLLKNKISRKKGMLIYMLNLYVQYSDFINKHDNDSTILLVDQGLVQGIGSLSLGCLNVKTKGLKALLKSWKRFESQVLLVDCRIPAEESVDRLTKRNTSGGEFDRLRGNELTNAMRSHILLLEKVREELRKNGFCFETVSLDMQNPIKSNIEMLYKQI